MEHADVLIVGGGSAGAALAARLSEEPKLRVLLVEAGRDTAPGAVPDDIQDIFPRSFLNPGYFWPSLTARMTDGDSPRPFPQARVMGGGSSVMGMIALRGLPSDYDAWEAMGARNWGWRDVLPYFRGLTRDLDRPAPERNTSGAQHHPSPAAGQMAALHAAHRGRSSRPRDAIARRHQRDGGGRLLRHAAEPGQRARNERALLPDARGPRAGEPRDHGEYAGAPPSNDGNRVSWRRRRARRRNQVAVGVRGGPLRGRDQLGGNPAALGNWPGGRAAAARYRAVADRPGVGRNYQNHSLLHFALTLDPQSRLAQGDRHYTMTSLRFSSGLEGCPAGDLFLYFVGRVSGRMFGTGMGMIAAALYAPFSRGSVTLRSRDPDVPPEVSQRLLSDPRDAKRMVIATRFAEQLISSARSRIASGRRICCRGTRRCG